MSVFCQISCSKKYQVDQHVSTAVHKENVQRNSSKRQRLITTSFATKPPDFDNFNADLCYASVASNIPLKKLDSLPFQQFLSKYCDKHIPSESILRKKYVNILHEKTMNEIKNTIAGNMFWIAVDETTDAKGRYVANLIIGILDENTAPKPFLISVKQLEKTNNLTISRFVNESLASFFLPESIPTKNLLLLLSDAAPYMVKAGNSLKIFFPNLIHLTCLAHGINRVGETIRERYKTVNSLISNMKKLFIKAPLRVQRYKENFPNLLLPPEPVITRWGTWINAAVFYADNFQDLKKFIADFDADCAAIVECKKLFLDKQLAVHLSFIKSHFSCFVPVIKNLQTIGLPLTESLHMVEELQENCKAVPSETGKIIAQKFSSVLKNNPGYEQIKHIYEVLNGSNISNELIDIDPLLVSKLKYSPITSCDVERSFSAYKNVLSDRRQSFLMENVEKYLIVYCFSR